MPVKGPEFETLTWKQQMVPQCLPIWGEAVSSNWELSEMKRVIWKKEFVGVGTITKTI